MSINDYYRSLYARNSTVILVILKHKYLLYKLQDIHTMTQIDHTTILETLLSLTPDLHLQTLPTEV